MSNQAVQRVFWGWDRPVLEAAIDFLTAGLPPHTTLDLADTVLMVPTAEAGRRLRRALADWANARGSAVSVPHVWPPHLAFHSSGDSVRVASDLQSQIAWMQALEKAPPAKLTALLPKLPDPITWSWLKSMAATLSELQEILGAGGLSMAEVAAAEALPETERRRWRDLAGLEEGQQVALAQRGLANLQECKRHRAYHPELPTGVRRIWVLAAPDLPPLLDPWLAACAQAGMEVVIAVQAPAEEEANFDAMGRPLPAAWGEDANVVLPLNHQQLHPCSDPGEQADVIVSRLHHHAAEAQVVALGVCDAEITPLIKERLEGEGLKVFDPGGVPMTQDGFWHLLALTTDLAGDASWSCLTGLVRIRDIRAAWQLDMGGKTLAELDRFAAEHLPGSLEMAAELLAEMPLQWEHTRRAVQAALSWRTRFLKDPMPDVAHAWMTVLQGDRQFNTSLPADHQRAQLAWAWLEEVEQVATAALSFGLKSTPAELWSLVLERLQSKTLEPARGDIDLVLQGWLELLWEPAPALVVAGLNEEMVPGILNSHAFLPDSLRQTLGLPCQRTRFARDAYLLKALIACRHSSRLDLLCGRWSRQGDARKPSRLLMLCPLEALPARVALLFPEKEAPKLSREPARSLAWSLQPELREPSWQTISPSRLRDYLKCPFRFYLRHVLRMESVTPPGREMDALGFGNAIHDILKEFGLDEEARALTDAAAILRWQDDALARWMRARFGQRPPPLVRLQLEAAAQRLHALADMEAMARQEGWDITAVELALGGEDDPAPLILEGARLSGKVDRVETHRHRGEMRLIDFKSADKATPPLKAHCASKRTIPADKEWRLVQNVATEKPLLWVDLQLPLYAAALRQRYAQPMSQVLYGCLPKAVLETQWAPWEGFDESWERSAIACAEEALLRIKSGVFWPPDERAQGEFDELFLGDLAATARPPG